MTTTRRQFLGRSAASLGAVATAVTAAAPVRAAAPAAPPTLRAPRLRPGDTIALINPSGAVYERAPYAIAAESLQALGFKVREAPNLRARYGHFAGTDAQRAADVNAMFADPTVHGLLALAGGSGGNRMLPLVDYAAIRRTPKFLGGFSDLTALINAVQVQTGLVTFHCPVGVSEWNAFSVGWLRGAVMDAQALTLANPQDKDDTLVAKSGRISTLRGGKARGALVGGNLAVLAAMAGSAYWPRFDGAILFLEDINEYIYRVDRMLSTLKLSGALDRVAGVVLGGFTNCGPGDGNYGTLTLDEVFDDYFKPLNVPVYSGALFGHVKRKFTLPVGLEVEMDADAGTMRFLQPAVT
ncbi:MAG: LD-carboxypeptidase [Leptothrix sp. (in: Bacteria)]|nr:LD-carboxypeptidase [Leptothrix sp. (in: b-proteobacteria)]